MIVQQALKYIYSISSIFIQAVLHFWVFRFQPQCVPLTTWEQATHLCSSPTAASYSEHRICSHCLSFRSYAICNMDKGVYWYKASNLRWWCYSMTPVGSLSVYSGSNLSTATAVTVGCQHSSTTQNKCTTASNQWLVHVSSYGRVQFNLYCMTCLGKTGPTGWQGPIKTITGQVHPYQLQQQLAFSLKALSNTTCCNSKS